MPKTYTVKEAAKELELTPASVYNYINTGLLKYTKDENSVTVISAADLRALKKKRSVETTKQPNMNPRLTNRLRERLLDLGDEIVNDYPKAFESIADDVYEIVNRLPGTGYESNKARTK